MNVGVKKLSKDAIIPSKGSDYAAGYDLYLCNAEPETEIKPGETVLCHTGIAMDIPQGYTVEIYARSGLAAKKGLRPANCVGLVDEDYRGEFLVALHNDSDVTQYVKNKERIAQAVFRKYYAFDLVETDTLSETERDNGGFGSTGV